MFLFLLLENFEGGSVELPLSHASGYSPDSKLVAEAQLMSAVTLK